MSFYGGLADTAERLIDEYGRTVTVRTVVKSGAANDPVLTASDTSSKAVFANYNQRDMIGGLIKQGDIMVLVKTAVSVDETSLILDGSVVYSVVDIATIKPGDTLIMYKIQARRQ